MNCQRSQSDINKIINKLFNKFSIFNEAKYFSSRIFQNYLVFNQLKNTLDFLVALLELICGSPMECQKKILKT